MSSASESSRRGLLRAIVLLEISVELIKDNESEISLDETDYAARIDQAAARLESILETVTREHAV